MLLPLSVLFIALARSIAAVNDQAEAGSTKAESKDNFEKEFFQISGVFAKLLCGEVCRPQPGPGERDTEQGKQPAFALGRGEGGGMADPLLNSKSKKRRLPHTKRCQPV